MLAKDFNELTDKYVMEQLAPLGFKKSGTSYYLYKAPDILVFHKKVHRGSFEGFYVALTHDFISNTRDKNGKLKIPGYAENYPFSIPVEKLKSQYEKHKNALQFSYDTNFMTREVLTTRKFTNINPLRILTFNNIQQDAVKAENYIKSSVDIMRTYGMKLLAECPPQLSYRAVTRHKGVDDAVVNGFRQELEEYLKEHSIEIPKPKMGWFAKLFKK